MKGKTVVELIDIKTKEAEVLEDDNLVTDVVEKILTLNPNGLVTKIEKNTFYPLVEKVLGGILLFKDKIVEDKNTTFTSTSNDCVGYAGQIEGDQKNSYQGSFNKEESKPTSAGYKYVWDFGTSKANGKISAIGLTNEQAGGGYFGTKTNGRVNRIKLGEDKVLLGENSIELRKKYINVVEGDFENNFIVSIIPESDHLKIIKSREPLLNFKLHDNLGFLNEKPLKETKIKYKKSYGNYNVGIYSDAEYYYFLKANSSSTKTTITKLKIKKEDNTFEESEFILENINIGNLGSYSLEKHNYSRNIRSVLRDGYIYVLGANEKQIIKFAINNPVDVTKIEASFTMKTYSQIRNTTGCNMYILGDMIVGTNFTIDKNDVIKEIEDTALSSVESTPITYGPFLLGYFGNAESHGDKYLRKVLYLITPYLATINNLSKTIEKTADKTMKITYYLTGGR